MMLRSLVISPLLACPALAHSPLDAMTRVGQGFGTVCKGALPARDVLVAGTSLPGPRGMTGKTIGQDDSRAHHAAALFHGNGEANPDGDHRRAPYAAPFNATCRDIVMAGAISTSQKAPSTVEPTSSARPFTPVGSATFFVKGTTCHS